MHKVSIIAVVALIIVLGYLFRPQKAQGPVVNNNTSDNKESEMTKLQFPGILAGEKISDKVAVITTGKGEIEIELYAGKAPKTVSNFIYLVEQGFYNNLNFHRVEPDFVIQGGDPKGNGTGGPGYKFEDEPVIGDYLEGTVAMANSGPNTNGSQFFICLEDLPRLPKNYNLFGQVSSGMDVVKKIVVGDKIERIIIKDKNS